MSVKVSPFLVAMGEEMTRRWREMERRELRDLVRDANGLPSVEVELGWRVVFRSLEGGKD